MSEDPGIASRVVKLASSAIYNPMGAQLDSVQLAVMRVGLLQLRDIVTAAAVVSAFDGHADAALTRRVWLHSFTSGIAAGLLASRCQGVPVQTPQSNPYFLAGLMHDIGILIVAPILGDRMQTLLDESIATELPVHELEREELGFSHADAGAALVTSWGLPDAVIEIARHHHQPERAPESIRGSVEVIHVADWLADRQGYGWGELGGSLCDDAWDRLGVPWDEVDALIEEFDRCAAESARMLASLNVRR